MGFYFEFAPFPPIPMLVMGIIKIIKSKLLITLLAATAIFTLACTPQSSAPNVDNPSPALLNIKGCKAASLSFQTFTATNVKSLVNCLNGSSKAMQPVKDFLDSANEADLNQLFQALNLHLAWGSTRQVQLLDLLKLMENQGYLKALYRNFEVLARTGLITHVAKASIVALAQNSSANPDPDIAQLSQYIVNLIDSGLQTRALDALSLFNQPRAQAMALLLANSVGTLDASQVSDNLSLGLNSMLTDGSVHNLFTHLGEPKLLLTMKNTVSADRTGFNDVLKYFVSRPDGNFQLFRRAQITVRAADQPLECFPKNATNSKAIHRKDVSYSRKADNLLNFMVGETIGKTRTQNDEFLLQTAPLLLVATPDLCQVPPELIANFDTIEQLAQDGYSEAYGRFWTILTGSSRYDTLVDALKSNHVIDFAPTLGEMANRAALRVFWDFAGDDLTEAEAQTFSEILSRLVVENISGPALDAWINLHFSGSTNKISKSTHDNLLAVADKLPSASKNLAALLMSVNIDSGIDAAHDQMAAALWNRVADQKFKSSPELALRHVAGRVLAGDDFQKNQIHGIAQSLVNVWGDSQGGLGETVKILSDVNQLSQQSPFSDFVRDMLADNSYVSSSSPALVRLLQNSNFDGAISYLGVLAKSGDLEKLTSFLVDLLRQGVKPQGNLLQARTDKPFKTNFESSMQEGRELSSLYISSQNRQVVKGNYGPCLNLKGDLFEPTGNVFSQAVQCLNANGADPELNNVTQVLSSAKVLPLAVQLMSRLIKDSPALPGTLDQLESLLRSGQLHTLLNLYSLMGTSTYHVFDNLDSLATSIFLHPKADNALKILGWLSSQSNISQNLSTTVDLISNTPKPVFQSQNTFRLTVANPDSVKAQIAVFFPKASVKDLQNIFEYARENFETHNDFWLYQEGNYPKYNKDQFKATIILMMTNILRTTDLEEFLSALQDIGRDGSAVDFVKNLSQWQIVTLSNGGDGSTHAHIQTGLDALESLVLNGDFGYATVGNIGTTFQLAVEKSTDFVQTMNEQFKKLQLGYSVSNIPLLGNSEKNKHFENMILNFPALNLIAANKEMRVLQRQYQALYRSTPDADKENQDPTVNHMGLINLFNKLGFFENLSMGYQAALAQGQAYSISQTFAGFALKIRPQDVINLRLVIGNLLSQYNSMGSASPLDQGLELYWDLSANHPDNYAKFKTHLFHVMLAEDGVVDTFSTVLKALSTVSNDTHTMTKLLNVVFSDLQNDSSLLYTVCANLIALDPNTFNVFHQLIGQLLNRSDFGDTLVLAGDVYEKNPLSMDALFASLTAYSQDPRVKALDPQTVLKAVLQNISTTSAGQGVWASGAFLLSDPTSRQNLETLGVTLGQGKQLSIFNSFLMRKSQSGDLENSLRFLFDHFKKAGK